MPVIRLEKMASVSFSFSLGYGPLNLYSSNCQTSSLISSSFHFNKISSAGFHSRRTLLAARRNAVVSCSLLVHEAAIWTSMQPQLKSYWFLLSPSILVPLLAFSVESRKYLVKLPGSTRSVIFKFVPLLRPLFAQWQGVQRCAVQILAVLILANAFYSDIAPPDPHDTFENVPQDISGGEVRKRIQRPKSKKAERCTQKCVGTCIRGGAGSPGEGPLNIRKPLVVFKEGFRTRQYCLIECSDICNLIGDGDDGP